MKIKKILAFCVTLSILMLAFIPSTYATTANGMIYDAESIDGIDFDGGHGQGGGLVYNHPSPVQGEASMMMYTPSDEYMLCFQYNASPESEHVEGMLNLTGYSFVELDLYYMSEEDANITCDFQFSLIGKSPAGAPNDHCAQHGHDFDFVGVYFPVNQWIHVKVAMSDAIFHSPTNRDTVDAYLNSGGDNLHYSVDLANIVRSKYQFGFFEDEDGNYPMEGVSFLVDNVHASKTDSGLNNQLVEVGEPIPPLHPDEPSSSEPTPAVKYGDVDGNGSINAADALLALQFSISKVTLTEAQQKAANVDGIGKVTAADALLILQKSIGKINKFPIEN